MSSRHIGESLKRVNAYLSSYTLQSAVSIPDVANTVKKLHKGLYGLLCWKLELDRFYGAARHIAYHECVSDLLHALLLFPQGLYKACNAAHRSALENFARHVLDWGQLSLPSSHTAYDLFLSTHAVVASRSNPELTKRYQAIRQNYRELCLHVHSSGASYRTLANALQEYPAYKSGLARACARRLSASMCSMIGILLVIEPDVFNSMSHHNKDAILDNLSDTDKQALITVGHSAVFSRKPR